MSKETTKTVRAVIYLRVSTGRQAAKDLSLPAQEKACREFAAQNGLQVAQVFSDQGQSATTADRPAFLDALSFCRDRANRVEYLVCYDTSRFARNREDAFTYKKLLRKSGVKVHYASQSFGDDPDGQFMEGVLELIDERYSRVLGQVTLRGMREAARRGRLTGAHPPFGYDATKNPQSGKRCFIINEPEAKLVKIIFNQYLAGLGYKALATWLNERGHRKRNGKRWGWKALERMLQNETYIGTLCFQEIRTPDVHPRIIDDRTFHRVVAARAQRDHQADGSRQRSWHAFSGLLVCRFCGSKLTIEGATGRSRSYKYFSCRGKKDERSDCPGIRWRAEKLEAALEAKIIKVIFSEANFRRLDKELRAYQLKLATRRTDEMPHLKQKLKAVEDKIHRVVAKVAEATISDDDAKGLLTDLRRDKEHYLARIEEITGGPLAGYRITPATAKLLRAQVVDMVQNAGPRKKREFFRCFIHKIEVDATYCRVHYNLLNLTAPLASGSLQVGNLASPGTTEDEPLAKAVRLKVA